MALYDGDRPTFKEDRGNDVQDEVVDEPNPSAEELLDFATQRMDEIDKEIASLKDSRLAMERQARSAEKILAEKCKEARTRYQSIEIVQQLAPSAWTDGSA
jgi:hypothetical protein